METGATDDDDAGEAVDSGEVIAAGRGKPGSDANAGDAASDP